MDWRDYWEIVGRRWAIVAVIVVLDVLASGYLFARSYKKLGYQACLTAYVADVSAPSTIIAPQTSIQAEGQLLAGETAANFYADDVLDVAESQHVARFISAQLAPQRLPNTSTGDINGAISGSRRDRTLSMCVSNPSSASALAAASTLGSAMTVHRSKFLGPKIGQRAYVGIISDPSVGKVSSRHDLLNLGLRIILGLLLAIGVALIWDAIDPRVRNRRDVERTLGVPVLSQG
jgi:capsular polysaccharide biosynthesis protein